MDGAAIERFTIVARLLLDLNDFGEVRFSCEDGYGATTCLSYETHAQLEAPVAAETMSTGQSNEHGIANRRVMDSQRAVWNVRNPHVFFVVGGYNIKTLQFLWRGVNHGHSLGVTWTRVLRTSTKARPTSALCGERSATHHNPDAVKGESIITDGNGQRVAWLPGLVWRSWRGRRQATKGLFGVGPIPQWVVYDISLPARQATCVEVTGIIWYVRLRWRRPLRRVQSTRRCPNVLPCAIANDVAAIT